MRETHMQNTKGLTPSDHKKAGADMGRNQEEARADMDPALQTELRKRSASVDADLAAGRQTGVTWKELKAKIEAKNLNRKAL